MSARSGQKLQEAVFSLLSSDGLLAAKLTGVYDQPVENAAYPYLEMGETSLRSADVKDRFGEDIEFEVLVWSADPGQMEVKELMADIDALLHDGDLAVSGFDLIQIRRQNANIVRQYGSAGVLYRGRLRYVARIYEKATAT